MSYCYAMSIYVHVYLVACVKCRRRDRTETQPEMVTSPLMSCYTRLHSLQLRSGPYLHIIVIIHTSIYQHNPAQMSLLSHAGQ